MISIITPVYQGERFIESCIQCVIDQDCPHAEHIIVDGGSSDRTVEIIQEYAAKYPHIRWISEKDQGQPDAMNKGVSLAKGTIMGILNVDDYYEPNILSRLPQFFQDLPDPSLVVGNCNIFDAEDQLLTVNRPRRLKLTDLLLGPSLNPFPANPSAYFYHVSLHQKVGLYDVEDHFAQDLDFLLRAVSAATVKYVDETWGNFRFIPGTITFEDCKNGHNVERVEKILNTYRRQLTPIQKWELAFKRNFLRYKGRLKAAVKRWAT